jgi:serine/threonine protein kinase
VLIQHDGTACIADFGLSLYSEAMDVSPASSSPYGNFRWMAPELFGKQESPVRPTKQSDIYSFGGVMLLVCAEALTRRREC